MNLHTTKGRILGLDMARALAVIGMILVNYKLAMDPQAAEPGWIHATTGILEGRVSALFVILAGIGVSLSFGRGVMRSSLSLLLC
ncbi:heparan-alpha-glucosaminide N-acetyltransferase domain-containing protein [Paenibacillus sp. TC-CSREp1]|uniref:heparan-alpha-glucosaminide N-acetyltransferase domain-containing protein n=1 Tax=Paenibacillus sp. TC-CSREp1 TaxID=3410089 RepID=UPI003D02D26B